MVMVERSGPYKCINSRGAHDEQQAEQFRSRVKAVQQRFAIYIASECYVFKAHDMKNFSFVFVVDFL